MWSSRVASTIGRQLRRLPRSTGSPHIVERAGLAQLVLEVGVAQVVGVHRPRQVGASAFQYSRSNAGGVLALEVVVHDVRPDEVVGAQAGERRRRARCPAGCRRSPMVASRVAHGGLVDEDADVAGVGEVEHRREEREARDRVVALRRQHRERRGEQRAADAEAERVDLVGCRVISLRDVERRDARLARGSRPSVVAVLRRRRCATTP